MSTNLLREALSTHLDEVEVPPGDLTRAMREGRTRRRRRRGIVVGAVAVATAGVVGAVLVLGPGAGTEDPDTEVATFPPVGALDGSEGLRAYADPGRTLYVGGLELEESDYDWLDTDATATPAGIVFYDNARPYLLGLDGETTSLVDGPVDPLEEQVDGEGFHPTAKTDVDGGVAFATMTDGVVTVAVRDDPTADAGASTSATSGCGDACDARSLVIDAYDRDVVWGHTDQGAVLWNTLTGEWHQFSNPDFRIADVRNGTILYDGKLPPALRGRLLGDYAEPAAGGDLRLVQGALDATLSFDGRHVLDWSPVLAPVDPASDDPVRLAVPGRPMQQYQGFYAFDTDGSVLVATLDSGQGSTIYDCPINGASCEELGTITGRSGDPEFIGNDM